MHREDLDPEYKAFRLAVLRRDGFKCQMPNCGGKEQLHVHHIQTYAKHKSLRTDPKNGITLCATCHRSIYGVERRWEPVFLSITLSK